MQKQPLVSIIIPTYNRAHLIGETLDSVIAQTYQYWECIVVDDGSKDHTDQVMQTYCNKDPRIQYHHRPEVHLPGGNGARNYGFKVSKGEYIQWFDSDDLMKNTLLSKCIDFIEKDKYDFVVTNFENINSSRVISYNFVLPQISHLLEAYLLQKIILNTPTLFYRKKSISIIFNEDLSNAQDLDFITRYLFQKKRGVINNNFLICVKKNVGSITFQHKNKSVNHMLTDLKVRTNILKLANKELPYVVKELKYKLLVKTLKLGKVNKPKFYQFILMLRSENIISLKEFLKIVVCSTPYIYTKKKGKEFFKKAIK